MIGEDRRTYRRIDIRRFRLQPENISVLSQALTDKDLRLLVGENCSRAIFGSVPYHQHGRSAKTSPKLSSVWILQIAALIKNEEHHMTDLPSDSHTAFYFPPSILADGPPLQRGKCAACSTFVQHGDSSLFMRKYSASPCKTAYFT